jgi:hypothetical protein
MGISTWSVRYNVSLKDIFNEEADDPLDLHRNSLRLQVEVIGNCVGISGCARVSVIVVCG